jgi:transposase-like protein
MKFLHKIPRGWHPPHCPNPKCRFHNPLAKEFPFKEDGTYLRKTDNKRIQRYLCLSCRRSFSTQTFSVTYWLKKPDLIKDVFMKTVGGMANRQIARDLKLNPGTIDHVISRIARHCFLFHSRMTQKASPPSEIVIDGFVTFENSQYFPFHHQNAVEKDTDFFIYFTDSEVRRSGTMTENQKKRRSELEKRFGRPDPQAVRKDMTHLLDVTLSGQTSAVVHSDNHRSYPRAIRETDCRITHIGTPGREHRDRRNRLWSINLLDLLIRHSSSNHKRETIAWSKRRQSSAERLVIFLVWRNYVKGRREKEPRGPTPAMARGMVNHRMGVEEIFSSRIFRDHVELPARWSDYYDRKVVTRSLEKNNVHDLKYGR